jgi:hypothetical protein
MASRNGFLEGIRTIRPVIAHSSELGNIKIAVRKNRSFDTVQNFRNFTPWIVRASRQTFHQVRTGKQNRSPDQRALQELATVIHKWFQ